MEFKFGRKLYPRDLNNIFIFVDFLLRYVVGQRSFLKIATYVYRKN